MIRKVQVQDLRLGMYIHDLNWGWWHHGFVFSHFMLRRQEDLEKLQDHPKGEVFIDTIKGMDLPQSEEELKNPGSQNVTEVSFVQELKEAQLIRDEAIFVAQEMMQNARLGRQVEIERLEPVVSRITDSILRNPGALVSLCRMKEGDTYTFQHCVSVSTLLVAFCRSMGMDKDMLVEAGLGAMLHDLGKMRVPDHILNKPGRLLEAEFTIMKQHVAFGLEILVRTPGISERMMQIAGEHHERFDGSGYPKGLKGREISLIGRMMAIVDVYDAITSNRIYHRGMEPPAALQRIYGWSEHHFDPELVQQFIQTIGIYPVGSLVLLESGRLALVLDQGGSGLLFPKVRILLNTRTRQPIEPYDIDLSEPDIPGDHVIGEEDPFEWNLDTYALMGFR